MNRKALIIGNPGEIGEKNYCEGVKIDLELYRSFLTSPIGGAWRNNEIETIFRPSTQDVSRHILSLRNADYSFVAFCGHGHIDRNEEIVVLRRGEELSADELRKGARKHTLILDCCRVIRREVTARLDEAVEKMQKRAPLINPDQCRLYFDAAISKCDDGIVVLHSCAAGESAGDSEVFGGYYSSSLMLAAQKWAEETDTNTQTHYATRDVVWCHNQAKSRVITLSNNTQNPSLEKPRSEPYFPLTIVA